METADVEVNFLGSSAAVCTKWALNILDRYSECHGLSIHRRKMY